MAGRPKTRARRQEEARLHKRKKLRPSALDHVEALYSEEYSTFDSLRAAMVQKGIVDHGINPFDVIQRAIDDTSMDYMLLRKAIDKDTHGDPNKFAEHPLYEFHEHVREAMVRYSTFAMQYDIQRRQLKFSESRVALLAVTLRTVLTQLGVSQEKIKQAPTLLIEALKNEEPLPTTNTWKKATEPKFLDANKAEALSEILMHDSEVTILPADPEDEQN